MVLAWARREFVVALWSQFRPPLVIGAGAVEGVGGYFMNNKIELTGQGLCVGTGWTVQGVRECLSNRGPHSSLVGPGRRRRAKLSSPKPGGSCFFLQFLQQSQNKVGEGQRGAPSTSAWGVRCGPGRLALTLCCQRRCHPGAIPPKSSLVLVVGAGWGCPPLPSPY